MRSEPRLVVLGHGTRVAAGNDLACAIARTAGDWLGVPASAAYVELGSPLISDALSAAASSAVVVPLLLSRGHHVSHDVAAACESAPVAAWHTGSLGPAPELAQASVARLVEAGWDGGSVALLAAGSRDPASVADLEAAAALLADELGVAVQAASLSGAGPRLHREQGVRWVAPYLMAEGHFLRLAREAASDVGAQCVGPLGGTAALPDPHVVALVARRYVESVELVGSLAG